MTKCNCPYCKGNTENTEFLTHDVKMMLGMIPYEQESKLPVAEKT